ncbi:hypothetical protein STEG23_036192, partial [Scotinomys teguina]
MYLPPGHLTRHFLSHRKKKRKLPQVFSEVCSVPLGFVRSLSGGKLHYAVRGYERVCFIDTNAERNLTKDSICARVPVSFCLHQWCLRSPDPISGTGKLDPQSLLTRDPTVMGKHFLLLLLGLSLVVGFLQALTCLECYMLNADGECEKGESTCEAKDDEECAILVVSKDLTAMSNHPLLLMLSVSLLVGFLQDLTAMGKRTLLLLLGLSFLVSSLK